MPKSTPDALRATADWLEANRDNHIQVALANGENENPFADNSTCFCAYGRFIVELDNPDLRKRFNEDDGNRLARVEELTGVEYFTVYTVNDRGRGDPVCNGDHIRGNADVIPYLRVLATTLETKS